MNHEGVEYDIKFKALMLGSTGVGKTSLVKALEGKHPHNTLPTVGKSSVIVYNLLKCEEKACLHNVHQLRYEP